MTLTINGQEQNFENEISLLNIMNNLKITDKVMAAAVNMEIVKKDQWDKFQPKENDKIELLQFVGGG
jgi:sulfur carrier protein